MRVDLELKQLTQDYKAYTRLTLEKDTVFYQLVLLNSTQLYDSDRYDLTGYC